MHLMGIKYGSYIPQDAYRWIAYLESIFESYPYKLTLKDYPIGAGAEG